MMQKWRVVVGRSFEMFLVVGFGFSEVLLLLIVLSWMDDEFYSLDVDLK